MPGESVVRSERPRLTSTLPHDAAAEAQLGARAPAEPLVVERLQPAALLARRRAARRPGRARPTPAGCRRRRRSAAARCARAPGGGRARRRAGRGAAAPGVQSSVRLAVALDELERPSSRAAAPKLRVRTVTGTRAVSPETSPTRPGLDRLDGRLLAGDAVAGGELGQRPVLAARRARSSRHIARWSPRAHAAVKRSTVSCRRSLAASRESRNHPAPAGHRRARRGTSRIGTTGGRRCWRRSTGCSQRTRPIEPEEKEERRRRRTTVRLGGRFERAADPLGADRARGCRDPGRTG